jgi:hypothetical protein
MTGGGHAPPPKKKIGILLTPETRMICSPRSLFAFPPFLLPPFIPPPPNYTSLISNGPTSAKYDPTLYTKKGGIYLSLALLGGGQVKGN